jgi:hypothetical protein
MANTIQQTSLNVSINEQISINGVTYGNNITKSFADNGKVDQRVMQISSTRLTEVFNYHDATPDTAGSGVKSEFTYFRITNTDDALGITIQLYVSATKSGFFHLPAGCSFVLMSNDMDFLCEGDAFSLADLVSVKAKTDLSGEEATTSYLEYVAVFEGGVDTSGDESP